MKITYISHATLLIETNGLKIVTDPWVTGSAYCNQWYLFPKAANPELIKNADFVLYTHGHEDHLHVESLKTINRNAKILYPYSWYGGIVELCEELGFNQVEEIVNERTVQLDSETKVTFLANNLDTILVLEHKQFVIVNINDALPSASEFLINHFIAKIKKRWNSIDFVFSSYGAASYFPNTVHYKDKNDIEIGEVREQFFMNNFCKLVEGINPKYAIPFASDFVLLDDEQRWINETKFPRNKIKDYFQNFTNNKTNIEIIEAYPSDYFIDFEFHKISKYHQLVLEDGLLHIVDEEYSEEIHKKRNFKLISEKEQSELFGKIKDHIKIKKYIIPAEIRQKIKFAIKIKDGGNTKLIVDFRNESNLFIEQENLPNDLDLLIVIKSEAIRHAIESEWGGDAIIIGYAAEIFIYNPDAIIYEYENYCVRLLSRYPNTKEYLKRTPFRGLKYLLSDSLKRKNILGKLINNKPGVIYFDEVLTDRNIWLTKSKCDVCKACNI